MNAYPECVEFVAALVGSNELVDRLFAWQVRRRGDRQLVLEYITGVMTDNGPNTRAYEIAWIVCQLLGGVWAAA